MVGEPLATEDYCFFENRRNFVTGSDTIARQTNDGIAAVAGT